MSKTCAAVPRSSILLAEAMRQRRPSELDVTMDEPPVDSSADAASD